MARASFPSQRRRAPNDRGGGTGSKTRNAGARRRRMAAVPADKDGRERILSAAIRSFSEVGYGGTTTADVARQAGVTQPLVHHHFGSKDGLWHAVIDELFADLPTVDLPSSGSPAERLCAVAEQFVRFVAARPQVTRVVAREGAAPSPRLTYLVDRYLREPFRAVVDEVRAGQRAGEISAEVRPDLFLFLFLGAGSHLFDVTALAHETLGIDTAAAGTQEDFAALLVELLRHGLLRGRTTSPAARPR